MELTTEDKAVLAHILVDPTSWVDHAVNTVGESAVREKIEKYKGSYFLEKDSVNYKTRAERD